MKKLIYLALGVMLALSAVSAFAEEGTDIAGTDATSNSAGLLGLLFGVNTNATPESEPKELAVGEKVTTDTAEFEVVSLAMSPIERNKPSGWMTITGSNSKAKFMVDSDCCVLTIVYRVKNTSTKSKWYWPSNLMVHVKWDEYEFEKLDAQPYGDLQCTQTKEYIAGVEIPNEIAQAGYEDLIIEIGFRESFESISDMRYADHRFILPPLAYTKEVEAPGVPVMDGAIGGTGSNPLSEYRDKETIKAVQQALNESGYSCGSPDGVAGKNTKNAIRSYQTDKGLTVTGTVTHELLVSLGIKN